MLEALKFVKGSVAKKDNVPEFTHFRIAGRRITGYNGRISLSSPIEFDIDCCPKAVPLIKAIEACKDTAQLHMTKTGRLAIKSGPFSTFVETLPEAFVGIEPQGEPVAIDGKLLPALRQLYGFVSDESMHPWATGILLDGDSAFSTDNVIVCQHWLGYHFKFRVCIPKYAITELLRIDEEPISLQVNANNATFFFEGDRWLRTNLIAQTWPDVRGLLDMACTGQTCPIVFDELADTLDKLAPFVDSLGRVYLTKDAVMTATELGTSIATKWPYPNSIFNLPKLRSVLSVTRQIDLARYPAPCPWYADGVRGLIVGMKS